MRRFQKTILSLLGPLWGCSGGNSDTGPDGVLPPDGVPAECAAGQAYPAGATEPMTLGEVLSPYSWPTAIHRGTGARTTLDLAHVPCATDPEIDWSPFDVLLFVSIPAW
jgi:hypothetical protein